MAARRLYQTRLNDPHDYMKMDVEDLLDKLQPNELEELNKWVDPDNNYLPASERCEQQTSKQATGRFDREALSRYLEEQALKEPDWPEAVPFEKKKRGQAYQEPKKVQPRGSQGSSKFDTVIDDEVEAAMKMASEKDLVDLAAFMGMHGLLNQVQYENALSKKGREKLESAGDMSFNSVVKAERLRQLPPEPENTTDVEKTIEQIGSNNPNLTELNWNNIRDVSNEKFNRLFLALGHNTRLEKLHLANTFLTDTAAKTMIDALQQNRSLTLLNVESNNLSAEMITGILKAININGTVKEFRAANQSSSSSLGHRFENEIANLLEANETLLKLGMHFNTAGARTRVNRYLQRNCDLVRQRRSGY